jgi:hypothetical protein
MNYYGDPDVQVWEIPAGAEIKLADHNPCHHTDPIECLLAGSVTTFWLEPAVEGV